MSEYIDAMLLRTNYETERISLDVGMRSTTNHTPRHVLNCNCTEIVGAMPEFDYVLLAGDQQEMRMKREDINRNKMLLLCNTDNSDIYGNVLMIKTNEKGDPINIDSEIYMSISKEIAVPPLGDGVH